VAGLIPPGSVAVVVPAGASQFHVGDHIAAFANGERLADGLVVGVDLEHLVVAVPTDAAPALTLAIPAGAVVLALLPP
ncbi:MAG: hypothetical protein ABIR68_08280, partial [Ilumatobacteraceae bacterium]